MARITITSTDLVVVPGPAFEAYGEDGPYTDWRVFVVYRPMAGKGTPMTLHTSFERRGEDEAQTMIDRIVKHGSINPTKWEAGDPWQAYHDGETLQERLAPYGSQWEREERERRGMN